MIFNVNDVLSAETFEAIPDEVIKTAFEAARRRSYENGMRDGSGHATRLLQQKLTASGKIDFNYDLPVYKSRYNDKGELV